MYPDQDKRTREKAFAVYNRYQVKRKPISARRALNIAQGLSNG